MFFDSDWLVGKKNDDFLHKVTDNLITFMNGIP